jgi:agmatinase
MSQQAIATYLRHGQTPFFRLPSVDTAGRGAAAYAGARAVLLGVPYDGGVTYQPGTRLGPYHIRRVSALVQSYHPVHGVDVFDRLRVVDGGNVVFPPFDGAAVRAAVEGEVTSVAAAGATPFVVGGDHSVTLPCLRALAKKHGQLAVVHVDSHSDTSGPELWGDPFHHGTPLRHALSEKLIGDEQLYQIGLRGPWGTSEDGLFALSHGAKTFSAEEVAERGVMDVVGEVLRGVGDRPVYLTFDIGAVDPAYAPGTGLPIPGGLSSREALQLVRELGGVNLVGMDLVEVAPPLDHSDITSHLAAHLLYEGIALLALR